MTNPISVLLIIGAAVVGPIEAQPVPLMDCKRTMSPGPECFRAESLPQLCERAMREAGAERDVRGHWWLYRTVDTADPLPNDYNKPPEVRCIPTPTGYRK